MFLHLENNYEHPLELVSPKILCEALRSIKQVSGRSLFLTVGPSQMCIRKLNETLFFVSVFAYLKSEYQMLGMLTS